MGNGKWEAGSSFALLTSNINNLKWALYKRPYDIILKDYDEDRLLRTVRGN